MYAGDEIYGDDVTSGLDALRDIVDPDEEDRCVDCGVEVDGLGPPICRECADGDA